jgi:hypothetical protein
MTHALQSMAPQRRRFFIMDGLQQVQSEMLRLRERVEDFSDQRNEDRIRRAEELSDVRVSIRTVEARLKVLEDGLGRLMTHSTWLLRLLVGGFLAALLQFTIKGGLLGAL